VVLEDLRQYIRDCCFQRHGRIGLNARVSRKSWWVNRRAEFLWDKIYSETQFLDSNVKFPERIYCILNNERPKKCVVCGKDTNFNCLEHGYCDTCSVKCSGKNPVRIEKIIKNTDHAACVAKSQQTTLLKYGNTNYYCTDDFKLKSKLTKIERYGDENYNNIEKARNTCLEKYGVSHKDKLKTQHISFDEVYDLHFNRKISCVEIAEMLDSSVTYITKLIHRRGFKPITQPVSKEEREMAAWLISSGINHETSNREILGRKEIDIFLPEYKLGIELNGLYWHSYNEKETKQQIYKHLNKRDNAESKGVRLIQFTDKEWNTRREICKSIILNAIGIHERIIRASKCEICVPSNDEYRDFLEENHIQGFVNATEIYGLKYEGELVAIIAAGKSRYSRDKYELLRFAVKKNYKIHGAASKLFIKIKRNNLISYCSRDYFSGKLYENLGFEFSHKTSPGYFYVKNGGEILNRVNAQKFKLKKLLPNFDESLTEYQNMFNHGYRRYWNCGNSVWIYNQQ